MMCSQPLLGILALEEFAQRHQREVVEPSHTHVGMPEIACSGTRHAIDCDHLVRRFVSGDDAKWVVLEYDASPGRSSNLRAAWRGLNVVMPP